MEILSNLNCWVNEYRNWDIRRSTKRGLLDKGQSSRRMEFGRYTNTLNCTKKFLGKSIRSKFRIGFLSERIFYWQCRDISGIQETFSLTFLIQISTSAICICSVTYLMASVRWFCILCLYIYSNPSLLRRQFMCITLQWPTFIFGFQFIPKSIWLHFWSSKFLFLRKFVF